MPVDVKLYNVSTTEHGAATGYRWGESRKWTGRESETVPSELVLLMTSRRKAKPFPDEGQSRLVASNFGTLIGSYERGYNHRQFTDLRRNDQNISSWAADIHTMAISKPHSGASELTTNTAASGRE